MKLALTLVSHLWWGPIRGVFEPFARRILGQQERIVLGPLRGCYFAGGLHSAWVYYEIHVQRVLLRHLKPGDRIIDIGGNNGFFSLLVAKQVGEQGFVYIFEPFPANIEKIKQVIVNNEAQL